MRHTLICPTGVVFTVGDALLQYFVIEGEEKFCPSKALSKRWKVVVHGAEANDHPLYSVPMEPPDPSDSEVIEVLVPKVWDTGRSFTAFVIGSTIGTGSSLISMLVKAMPLSRMASLLSATPFGVTFCLE